MKKNFLKNILKLQKLLTHQNLQLITHIFHWFEEKLSPGRSNGLHFSPKTDKLVQFFFMPSYNIHWTLLTPNFMALTQVLHMPNLAQKLGITKSSTYNSPNLISSTHLLYYEFQRKDVLQHKTQLQALIQILHKFWKNNFWKSNASKKISWKIFWSCKSFRDIRTNNW